MKRKLLLITIFLNIITFVYAQDININDSSYSKKRLHVAVGGTLGAYSIAMYGLWQVWYSSMDLLQITGR